MNIGNAFKMMNLYRRVAPYVDAAMEAGMQKQWRKALAAALACAVGLFGGQVGLTPEQIKIIAEALMVFVVGQGLADFGKNKVQ